jgi:hypothetical protein
MAGKRLSLTAARFLWPKGSRRGRRFALVPVLVALVALLAVAVAQAVHDENLFELGPEQGADILGDGNAANGPDWGDLFDANGNDIGSEAFGGLAAAFLLDDTAQKGETDRTTFSGAGGSNKNNDPISTADCASFTPPLTGSACDTWHWDAGNVPAKDDLVNSYTYATMPESGPRADHLILYGGLERLDPNGDSHLDLEFLQNPIDIVDGAVEGTAGIPCNDPGSDPTPCEFAGIREVDDVIVSMDFVQGGGIGTIEVRNWDGNSYELTGQQDEGEGCNAADTICGFNNGGLIDGGPWPNLDKSGAIITQLPQNGFTEIGVDVTALLGETPCISTVMGKSRSSQSFTAELKDFSAPASFPICGANISIEPDAVNEVGEEHTFTVTVNRTVGNATDPAPDGTLVDVTLTDANGADVELIEDNCATDGTVGGTCTVTFTSQTPGTITGHAAADVSLDGETRHVETDGEGDNSDDAVKRFVEAKIAITPDDTNSIEESHTFEVEVQQDDGLTAAQGGDGVSGFGPAPNGTQPTVTLTDAGGAINQISDNTCAGVGTVAGICSVTFTSNTAGTVTGHATVTFSVGGVSLTRATDETHGSTGDATKDFVDGSVAWFKDDNAGTRQGGATFQVCRTHNLNTETGLFEDLTPDVCVTVPDDTDGIAGPGPDEDPQAGEFLLSGLRLGRYTVDETVAPPGFEPDPKVVTVELTLANPDVTIEHAFVNQRPIVKVTGFGYTNDATGSPTSGIVSGTTTYTVNLHNYGGAATTLSDDSALDVTVTGAGAGTVDCEGDAPPVHALITGTIAADGNLSPPFELTCDYNNMADGAVITAALTVKYTTNGLEREASGSPATISFTIQND